MSVIYTCQGVFPITVFMWLKYIPSIFRLAVSMSPSAPSLSRALEVVAEGGSFECFKKGSGKLHAHVALHKDERLLVCTISDASSPKLSMEQYCY